MAENKLRGKELGDKRDRRIDQELVKALSHPIRVAAIMEQATRLVAEAHERSSKRLEGATGLSIIVGLAFEAGKRRAPDDQQS